MAYPKKLEKLYNKEDWDGIIHFAAELFDDYEEDVKVLNDLAVAYSKKEMFDEAYKVCKRIYDMNPKPDYAKQTLEIGVQHMRHHMVMGECYYEKGMYKEALQIFRRLKVLGTQFSEKYLFSAKVHLKEGFPTDAIVELGEMVNQTRRRRDSVKEVLNDIIKQYPMCEKAYDFMYDLLKSENHLEAKIEELEENINSGENVDMNEIYILGNFLRYSDKVVDSSRFFKTNLKKNKSDAGLLFFTACAFFSSGLNKEAIKAFSVLLKRDKTYLPSVLEKVEKVGGPNCCDPLLLKNLAGLYLASGNMIRGIACLELVLKLEPGNQKIRQKLAETTIKLINSHLKAKETKEAMEKLERLVKLLPEKQDFAKKLKQLRIGEEKKKIEEYEKQLETGSLSEEEANHLRMKLAEFYKSTGAENKRVSIFQQIAKSEKVFNPDIVFNIGISFLSKGLDELAYENFIKIAEAKIPDNQKVDMLYSIANAYQEKELYEKANEFYKKILSIDMEYKDVAAKISEVSENLGKTPSEKKEARSLEDRYEDIVKVGEGGMGAIYKARDKILGRSIALKVIRSEFTADEEALARFIREAQSASALQHPGVTTIYDISTEEPVYIAMELVEGGDMFEKYGGKMMDIKKFLSVAIDICNALNAAHEQGIVHRDIKLENIMLTKEGKIKIADFGLASITTSPRMTQSGQVMGTPLYMPPEQIKGQPTDNRSDIYALGITFYEMLTGNVPFKEGDIGYQHIHETPESPSFINPEISEELEAIIMKCLEKSPEDRYQKVGKITEDLKKC